MRAVTTDEETTAARRTAAAMHDTADKLEVAEAILHRSAERSPDTGTTARLHALGDQVTAQAHDIGRRADRLTDETRPAPHAEPADGERAQPSARDR